MKVSLGDLRRSPNALAASYSSFDVGNRLLLSGHSHQAWPDVALQGQIDAFDDAARYVGDKWQAASEKAEVVRDGFRRLLGDPGGEVALGASTHDLAIRMLSCLDLRRRPKLITTDGEFHSLRRQLARLAEEGIDLAVVPANPVDTLSDRLAAQIDDRTSAVLVSMVLFETARIVTGLDTLADHCRRRGVELVVDTYHALGAVPVAIHEMDLGSAWVLGGGYKYLQLGEGNCFLRLPPAALAMRPVVTGWFAEFGAIGDETRPGRVIYAAGADRFAGATYDPTSHYRAARVLGFFDEHGLSAQFLREVSLYQVGLLAGRFDALDLPEDVVSRDRSAPRSAFGGFLALRCRDPADLSRSLADRGVDTDHRGPYLRFGPAPYLSDAQLEAAMDALGEIVRAA